MACSRSGISLYTALGSPLWSRRDGIVVKRMMFARDQTACGSGYRIGFPFPLMTYNDSKRNMKEQHRE
jgi:hypothetical protein